MHNTVELRAIRTFEDLIRYLEDQLDWPLQEYGFEELTFEYSPEELGIKASDAAKISQIHQLRPLYSGQPWGIFFVEFESKKLPVVVLRRILSHLVVKKRASANKSTSAVWNTQDLLFISAFGEENSDQREIAFAHFHQEPGDLPSLRVLGWDGADTPLKLNHLDKVLHDHLRWPDKPNDQTTWRKQWQQPFRHRIGHIIRTADALAEVLAQLARNIRDRAQTMLAAEAENGPLRTLHKAFQTSLIHDLTEESFADTYAQTITYGLLTAAISRTDKSGGRYDTVLLAENITDMVPVTNPFLKEMLQTFLKVGGRKGGIDFDELGIQDVVELLRGAETDLPAILRDFGNRTRGEDPVIHFYEHFLTAYNKKLKVQRGVFYTPQPVVSYIVRSVHELLQTEFGLAEGLASTSTWAEMKHVNPAIQIPEDTDPDSPFVVILDPATGTATFLVEVIDLIFRTLNDKWRKQGLNERQREAAWNDYIPKHLLPRLYGYELMMAPYAIAHMKIGLKLFETGYRFGSDERARVFLTNALEPASDKKQTEIEEFVPALAHESKAVNEVKREQRFTLVIGNPPYSGHSINNQALEIVERIHDYKRGYPELQKPGQGKWLQNDYVKFIRLAEMRISESGLGILGFITDHSYLDNPTFKGMRCHLLASFPKIRIVDLHGNSKKMEKTPEGDKDENVFDITQGTSIGLFLRMTDSKIDVRYQDIWGKREAKYRNLGNIDTPTPHWEILTPVEPFHLFRPQNTHALVEYNACWSLPKIFAVNGDPAPGVVTTHDQFAISWSREEAIFKIEQFLNTSSESDAREYWQLCTQSQWNYEKAKRELKEGEWKKHLVTIDYRPFTSRITIFDSNVAVHRRLRVSSHMLPGDNLALCSCRQLAQLPWHHAFLANTVVDDSFVSNKTKERTYIFPLWLYSNPENKDNFEDNHLLDLPRRYSNLAGNFISALRTTLSHSFAEWQPEKSATELSAENIFKYIYAVLFSPGYRSRYSEFLKIDFPRIPLPGSIDVFQKLSKLGDELVYLHLLESNKVSHFITQYSGFGDNSVSKKPIYKGGAIWINSNQCFENVPEAVWSFHIGCYKVCEKWLKDRKGRVLSEEDIVHYQKIIVSLHETIRLMNEIDAVIDEHGGWPDAFHADSSQESA
ncbi:N-6 DNA methylase [Methylomonas montana]|uniref:type ISP restriction/modification enzyme n=1 Tax=Methylomonas montana TaxID=3058963 RepID=UPI002657CDFC|nr:type ISP restriction/modification enzyme [Methylomonas montana]WKJ90595.1 N-6 DNA methylase [Methylomonas montana]